VALDGQFRKRLPKVVPMIIISPFVKPLRNGKNNPKNYPYWETLIEMIDEPIVQVGVEGEKQLVPDFRKNLPIGELRKLIQECRTWISCDSFFQHLAWDEKKPGIVLWGPSDPLIFGHPENVNLLKETKMKKQKKEVPLQKVKWILMVFCQTILKVMQQFLYLKHFLYLFLVDLIAYV
jgi:ADP-heptose:LPS heptosyltransferase